MKTAVLSSLGKYRDFGLLVLRVGVGAMFILHGWPKISGGPGGWAEIGGAMGYLGIHVWPTVWGAAAAVAEFVGGILLVLGLFTRVAALLLLCTMIVAVAFHLGRGDGIGGASHAIELACVFFGLLLLGPGRHSVDGR